MVTAAKPKSDVVKKRARVLAVFLCVVGSVIITRLVYLEVVRGAYYKAVAENQYDFFEKLTPSRGEIKISDKASNSSGYTVATNIKKPLVYAVPKDIVNPNNTADLLAPILKMDAKDILPKLTDTSRGYIPIKKQLSDSEVEQIKALKLAGLGFDAEIFRVYPENNLLSQVLGFVGYKGDQKVGLYGLERAMEDNLKGKEGSIRQEKDVGGAWIFGGDREMNPAVDGDTLILTIDRTVQFKAQTIIQDAVKKNEADNGSITVLDPKTGAVIAMASYPDFNPNEYNKIEDPSIYLNKATQSAYEPGSVFKAITYAAALNEGKITPDTTYNDTGKIEVDGYTIENSDHKAHGLQTMTYALDESLNTGVIYAKNLIGNQTFYKYVQAFGFGKPTDIEIPEAKGNLDNLKANIKVNFHTASFGQGITVTPIQLAQAYDAIANKGVMVRPYLVASKIDAEGKSYTTDPTTIGRIISERAASDITKMLIDVVENGHGKKAAVPGYYLAGKTGTAQVSRSDGKGYEENNNIGSFAGFGPAEDPRFVIIVRVDHPRTVQFAESTAAPAFGEMAQFLLNYYNIPPTREIKK